MENLFASRVGEPRKYSSPVTRPLLLLSMLLVSILVFPGSMQAQTLPPLGTAVNFGILGSTGVTNTGASIVQGDVGVWAGTSIIGFPPGLLTGSLYTGPGPGPAETANADATTAYNDAANTVLNPCPGGNDLTGQDLGNVSSPIAPLLPGVYCFSTSAQLTGTLYLDFTSSSSFFIFQIGSTLTTASASSVVAVGSPPACVANNIIWQVGSSATIGTYSDFVGNILALTSITANTDATVHGRLLALNGAVTLDDNLITVPICVPVPEASSFWPGAFCASVFGWQWLGVWRRKTARS